jgi:hypothetical protein
MRESGTGRKAQVSKNKKRASGQKTSAGVMLSRREEAPTRRELATGAQEAKTSKGVCRETHAAGASFRNPSKNKIRYGAAKPSITGVFRVSSQKVEASPEIKRGMRLVDYREKKKPRRHQKEPSG